MCGACAHVGTRTRCRIIGARRTRSTGAPSSCRADIPARLVALIKKLIGPGSNSFLVIGGGGLGSAQKAEVT
jgi:hypothetical protein